MRHAARDRDHVRRLPAARDGRPRQPGHQVLVHLERAGQRARSSIALGGRRRRALRRDPLADADRLVPSASRASRSPARRPRPTPRACSSRRSATTTRCSSSSTSACSASRARSGDEPLPFGQARIARAGSDLTIVSAMKGVHDSLAAAEELAGEGIDCEVIDLRTIKPLDIETVIASVERTTRLLVVEEGPLTRRLGGRGHGARDGAGARARSTTPGASRRPTRRSRTARRSRTRSCRAPRRSSSP